jgi:hypothetical protein
MYETGCYRCGVPVTESVGSQGGRGKVCAYMNKRVRLMPNYTCVDVRLTDGKTSMQFATPVCRTCAKELVTMPQLWDEFGDRVVKANREADCHLSLLADEAKKITCAFVSDLTNELIAEGIIEEIAA